MDQLATLIHDLERIGSDRLAPFHPICNDLSRACYCLKLCCVV
nr:MULTISPECIES: hypothetical protein [Agrobacterium]